MKIPKIVAKSSFVLALSSVSFVAIGAQETIWPISQIVSDASDEQVVIFEGKVERQIDNDLYYISDMSGEIRLDTWIEGQGAVQLPENTKLRIKGVMDRDLLSKPEVYLRHFEEIQNDKSESSSTNKQSPSAETNHSAKLSESELPTIRDVRKNSRDESEVTFRGTVLRKHGDDAYILGDDTATIKVDAWIEGSGKSKLPIGEHIEVTGIMDKNWLGKKEIYLRSFTKQTKPDNSTID